VFHQNAEDPKVRDHEWKCSYFAFINFSLYYKWYSSMFQRASCGNLPPRSKGFTRSKSYCSM